MRKDSRAKVQNGAELLCKSEKVKQDYRGQKTEYRLRSAGGAGHKRKRRSRAPTRGRSPREAEGPIGSDNSRHASD
jgi:hypothetical protein